MPFQSFGVSRPLRFGGFRSAICVVVFGIVVGLCASESPDDCVYAPYFRGAISGNYTLQISSVDVTYFPTTKCINRINSTVLIKQSFVFSIGKEENEVYSAFGDSNFSLPISMEFAKIADEYSVSCTMNANGSLSNSPLKSEISFSDISKISFFSELMGVLVIAMENENGDLYWKTKDTLFACDVSYYLRDVHRYGESDQSHFDSFFRFPTNFFGWRQNSQQNLSIFANIYTPFSDLSAKTLEVSDVSKHLLEGEMYPIISSTTSNFTAKVNVSSYEWMDSCLSLSTVAFRVGFDTREVLWCGPKYCTSNYMSAIFSIPFWLLFWVISGFLFLVIRPPNLKDEERTAKHRFSPFEWIRQCNTSDTRALIRTLSLSLCLLTFAFIIALVPSAFAAIICDYYDESYIRFVVILLLVMLPTHALFVSALLVGWNKIRGYVVFPEGMGEVPVFIARFLLLSLLFLCGLIYISLLGTFAMLLLIGHNYAPFYGTLLGWVSRASVGPVAIISHTVWIVKRREERMRIGGGERERDREIGEWERKQFLLAGTLFVAGIFLPLYFPSFLATKWATSLLCLSLSLSLSLYTLTRLHWNTKSLYEDLNTLVEDSDSSSDSHSDGESEACNNLEDDSGSESVENVLEGAASHSTSYQRFEDKTSKPIEESRMKETMYDSVVSMEGSLSLSGDLNLSGDTVAEAVEIGVDILSSSLRPQ